MAILAIVLGGLTTMFVSAGTADQRQRGRLQAQQEARLGLVSMRNDLHCATAITAAAGPVATLTATLPALCFGTTGADVSVVFRTVLVSTGRYRLERVIGASTRQLADYLTYATPFTYTSPTSSTRGSLRADLRVDTDPSGGAPAWKLVDDIVLRNSVRT